MFYCKHLRMEITDCDRRMGAEGNKLAEICAVCRLKVIGGRMGRLKKYSSRNAGEMRSRCPRNAVNNISTKGVERYGKRKKS